MSTARTLPIPPAHREFTVKVDGVPLPREHQLLSATVSSSANRIAWARLCFLDGAAAASDFPLSNSDLFVPGKTIEVLAGADGQQQLLFAGIVVRHSLRIRDHSASQLIVECRHASVKLTVGRRSANYFDQSDGEVIEGLFSAARLDSEVEPTSEKHAQLVQFNVADWDFLLARAALCGRLVLTRGRRLAVKTPALGGNPVCSLQYGATLLELDAEIDAREQHANVVGVTWDPASQSVVRVDGAEPTLSGPGNLTPSGLAEVIGHPATELRHAAIDRTETQAWADANWLRARLNKVSGRGKCEGIGTIQPGDVVTLAGVGQRFNGDVFVTGVRHEFDAVQGWKTHVQFGGIDDVADSPPRREAPAAGGLIPAVHGLQIGVVVSNEDPTGEHRVRIRLPMVDGADEGIWARAASLDAGDNRGFCFRPEIDDEVIVGFLDDDPRQPVILGMLHGSAKQAPLVGSDENHQKMYRSRSGMQVLFDDEKSEMSFTTPNGNRLTLSDDRKSIVLEDQHGNRISLADDGIQLQGAKAVALSSGTETKVDAGTSLDVSSGTELKLSGGASAELSSSGITKVVGSMVHIN